MTNTSTSQAQAETIKRGLETYLALIADRDQLSARVTEAIEDEKRDAERIKRGEDRIATLERELAAERVVSRRLKAAIRRMINWLAASPDLLHDVAADVATLDDDVLERGEPQTMRAAIRHDMRELVGATPLEPGDSKQFAEIWGGALLTDRVGS